VPELDVPLTLEALDETELAVPAPVDDSPVPLVAVEVTHSPFTQVWPAKQSLV
jgi:hypothetical protein